MQASVRVRLTGPAAPAAPARLGAAASGGETDGYERLRSCPRRSLRTTNAIERLHEEFRRRVKTQAAHPHEQTVLRLFFGLYASGQIILRKIDDWVDLPQVLARRATAA